MNSGKNLEEPQIKASIQKYATIIGTRATNSKILLKIMLHFLFVFSQVYAKVLDVVVECETECVCVI